MGLLGIARILYNSEQSRRKEKESSQHRNQNSEKISVVKAIVERMDKRGEAIGKKVEKIGKKVDDLEDWREGMEDWKDKISAKLGGD